MAYDLDQSPQFFGLTTGTTPTFNGLGTDDSAADPWDYINFSVLESHTFLSSDWPPVPLEDPGLSVTSTFLSMAYDLDQSPQSFGLTTGITPMFSDLGIDDSAADTRDDIDFSKSEHLTFPPDDWLSVPLEDPGIDDSAADPWDGIDFSKSENHTSPPGDWLPALFEDPGSSNIASAASHPSYDVFSIWEEDHIVKLLDTLPGVRGSTYYDLSRISISEILADTHQKTLVSELKGEDAQQMVDFLNIVLRGQGILATEEGKSIWSLLCRLAKSAQVFPRCYELNGIICDSVPQAGGAFADVYKGEYDGRAICLKVVRVFQRQNNTRMLRAHAKELTLWAHLLHQNILPFYGVYMYTPGQAGAERIGLVSPWMSHGNVRDYLAEHPETLRKPLVSDIIAGLSYLHGLMIVHGDLKAQNVLVSDEGQALITDFGISRFAIITNKQATSQISNGTTRWNAPELIASDGDDDIVPTKECDIWSFSCLCYEVFTRQVPFYQYQSDYQVISALLKGDEIPLRPVLKDQRDGIDDHMWTLMVKCWDYVPQNRPSCEEIHQFIVNLEFADHRPAALTHVRNRDALQESLKAQSEGKIDYKRMYDLLRGIQLSNSQNISSADYAATNAVARKRRRFRCDQCDDTFTSRRRLREHSCPVLGRSQKYRHPRFVKRHVRVAHPESR